MSRIRKIYLDSKFRINGDDPTSDCQFQLPEAISFKKKVQLF